MREFRLYDRKLIEQHSPDLIRCGDADLAADRVSCRDDVKKHTGTRGSSARQRFPDVFFSMKQFVQLRLWPDAALEVVCAGAAKHDEPAGPLLEAATAYCRDHGFRATARHLDGAASDSLLSHAADSGADLIVHGSSFRKILLLERFGRNAVALLKRSTIPLFLSH